MQPVVVCGQPTTHSGVSVTTRRPYLQVMTDHDFIRRIRAAVFHTKDKEGEAKNLSEFAIRHLRPAVERLERKYNAGEEFPDPPGKRLPPGPEKGYWDDHPHPRAKDTPDEPPARKTRNRSSP